MHAQLKKLANLTPLLLNHNLQAFEHVSTMHKIWESGKLGSVRLLIFIVIYNLSFERTHQFVLPRVF